GRRSVGGGGSSGAVPIEPVAGDSGGGTARVGWTSDHVRVREEEPVAIGAESGAESEGVERPGADLQPNRRVARSRRHRERADRVETRRRGAARRPRLG